MIVLDASAAVEWLLQLRHADGVERRIAAADSIHLPHLWIVEVTQVLRRHVLRGRLTAHAAEQARQAAEDLPAHRYPHEPLGRRVWQLRDNLTAYDAVYVALAEVLDVPLVTTDARLAKTPGIRARMDLVS